MTTRRQPPQARCGGNHPPVGHCLAILVPVFICGQIDAANSISLTAAQREMLARLVRADPGAAALFRKLKELADASLNTPAHPVVRISTAGKLASDPDKVKSGTSLKDMQELHALGYAAAVTSNSAYAQAANRIILDWARTNQPTGTPVDETKLEPLFVAYDLTRPVFSSDDRRVVETWLRAMAAQEMEGARAKSITAINNWNSHRLKVVGLIGYLLEDGALVEYAVGGFKKQVEANLRPDGSSLDFHERDALHYHCYDLEPLLTLARVARQNGVDLYDYEAPSGASLRKSLNFVVPYCQGTATHSEWVHSKVAFDRERAEAGESKFQIGSKFDPRDGLRVLELASYFDPALKPLVGKLAGHAALKYPTWQTLLNEVARE